MISCFASGADKATADSDSSQGVRSGAGFGAVICQVCENAHKDLQNLIRLSLWQVAGCGKDLKDLKNVRRGSWLHSLAGTTWLLMGTWFPVPWSRFFRPVASCRAPWLGD